jgi:FMN reductase
MIVGLGGSGRPGSTSERALRLALDHCGALGAATTLLAGEDLDLPMYSPGESTRCAKAAALVSALRGADGILLASPGYHGSLSGLVKNALDYAEDLRHDARPYFDGRAIGLIACAAGWQAANSTLTSLRAIAHALRGWPTPLGATINSAGGNFDAAGNALDPIIARQIEIVAGQVVEFARMRAVRS